jgi:hypothetical protein
MGYKVTENEKRLIAIIQNMSRDKNWFNYLFDEISKTIYFSEECNLERVSLSELIERLELLNDNGY